MTPHKPLQAAPYRLSERHTFELYLGDITESGAEVIVSSTGTMARLSNKLSRAVITAGGEEIRAQMRSLKPIPQGSIAITTAGRIKDAKYVFHTVPTSKERRGYADFRLIDKIVRRCIQLADLLELHSLAIPPLGSGRGRRKKDDVVRTILLAAVDSLQRCRSLERVIFATTNPETYQHFHNRIVVQIMLAQNAQNIVALLPQLPPALYGTVGALLQQMDRLQEQAAQRVTAANVEAQLQALQAEAESLSRVARELSQALPAHVDAAAVQMVIATGNAIVSNVTFGAIAQQGGVAALHMAAGRDIIH